MKNQQVSFCLNINAQDKDVQVLVCGNIAQLGKWDLQKSHKLTLVKGQWVSCEPITITDNKPLEYKYLLNKVTENVHTTLETCENRKFEPEIYGNQPVIIREQWNVPVQAYRKIDIQLPAQHQGSSGMADPQLSQKFHKDKRKAPVSKSKQQQQSASSIQSLLLKIFLPVLLGVACYFLLNYQHRFPDAERTVPTEKSWQIRSQLTLEQSINSIELSEHDRLFITANNSIHIYSIQGSKFNKHPLTFEDSMIMSTLYLAEKKQLVSGVCDDALIVWDLSHKQQGDGVIGPQIHFGCVNSLQQDEKYFYSASSGDVQLMQWSKETLGLVEIKQFYDSLQNVFVDQPSQQVIVFTTTGLLYSCSALDFENCIQLNSMLEAPQFIEYRLDQNSSSEEFHFYDIVNKTVQRHVITNLTEIEYIITNIFQESEGSGHPEVLYYDKPRAELLIGTSVKKIYKYKEGYKQPQLLHKLDSQDPIRAIFSNGKYIVAKVGDQQIVILE